MGSTLEHKTGEAEGARGRVLFALTVRCGYFIAVQVAVRYRPYAYWSLTLNPFFDTTPVPGDPLVLCRWQKYEGCFYMQEIQPHSPAAAVRKSKP